MDTGGEVPGAAESLVQQAEGERLGFAPAQVAARDRAGPRRPVKGEDELLAETILEVAVVQPGVVGVAQARRGATSFVVRVVCGENERGIAGVVVSGLGHRVEPCSEDPGVPCTLCPARRPRATEGRKKRQDPLISNGYSGCSDCMGRGVRPRRTCAARYPWLPVEPDPPEPPQPNWPLGRRLPSGRSARATVRPRSAARSRRLSPHAHSLPCT